MADIRITDIVDVNIIQYFTHVTYNPFTHGV